MITSMAIAAVSIKDGIFIAGLVLIFLVAISEALGDRDDPFHDLSMFSTRRKEAARTAHLGYVVAVLTWACMVNFLEFRRGLETRVGLPEALAWILAPIGVVVLIGLSIAQFATDDKSPWWTWVGLLVLYLAAVYGYIAVAFGPSTFFESVDP